MGKLYVVPTPVGNLEDMTFRAIRILKEVDLILAEDTRTSGILLKHFEIKNAMQSHHKFNEHKTVESVVNRIKAGETVALISDAGTPGISDPGFLVVRECVRNGIEVQCLPGATAFVPALVASGLPNEKFCFEGFLPQKKGRMTKLKSLIEERRTMVFYESPHRLLKTLTQFAEYFGAERLASVSREISKLHEETIRGSLSELSQRNAELDEMMGTFNEIQEGFRQINDAESRVDLQRGTITENSASAKQQIASDIEFITKQMEENKAQIAKLQAMLKSSKNNSAQLKKAVESLTQELVTKQQRIEELQAELASKNIRIQELDAAVSGLSADKESLAAENEAKARTVAEQDKAINAAWFVFGTKSELKSQKILQSGDVLKNADFNKDYFTQIDIRTTKEIKLYSKRAELLTTHPAGSYELVKDDKGQLTLKITNPKEFWSVSKYLVIQVK